MMAGPAHVSAALAGAVSLTEVWSVWFLILQQAYSWGEAGSQEQEKHEKPLGAEALTCTRVILAYSSGQGKSETSSKLGERLYIFMGGGYNVILQRVWEGYGYFCDLYWKSIHIITHLPS